MMPMKDSEKALLVAIYTKATPVFSKRKTEGLTPRDVCNQQGQYKQNCYYLDKWTSKGWYEYGVSLDMGWLTEEGELQARRIADGEA